MKAPLRIVILLQLLTLLSPFIIPSGSASGYNSMLTACAITWAVLCVASIGMMATFRRPLREITDLGMFILLGSTWVLLGFPAFAYA